MGSVYVSCGGSAGPGRGLGSPRNEQRPGSGDLRYRPGFGFCGPSPACRVITHLVVFAAPFSADLTDWLSTTAAKGLALGPSARQTHIKFAPDRLPNATPL